MRIPTSYRKLTVEQFAECIKIYKSDLEPIDKDNHVLAYLSGKSLDYIESLDFKTLKYLYNQIAFLKDPNVKFPHKKVIFVGVIPYVAVRDVTKYNNSAYLTFKTYQERGLSQNLHKVLPYLYRPLFSLRTDKNGNYDLPVSFEKLEKRFLKKKVSDVYGAVFFYANVSKKLNLKLADYFLKNVKKINHHIKEVLADQDMKN